MHILLEEYGWYGELPAQGRQVVSRAIHEIDSNYGNGDEQVVQPFYYHNGKHTRMACEDMAVLKDALGLTRDEFTLSEAAMSAHDVVKTFDRPEGLDEADSADWLECELKKAPEFTRAAVLTGRLAIIGTTPRFNNGTIVQKAVEQDYPSKRAELIAHAVAGADLGRIFTPEGPLVAHSLFAEIQAQNGSQTLDLKELGPFQDSQIEFLSNYKYPRRDIESAMTTHKAPVIRYLSKVSGMLDSGALETWDELLQLDHDFIEMLRSE